MKKLLAGFVIALFAVSVASAKDGFYVGADLLQARAHHQYRVLYSAGVFEDNGAQAKATSTGFSLNSGYKFNLNKVFIAPEIFYDRLNNSANDFTYQDSPANYRDNINMNSRYGAKINLGYNIFSKFAVFANAGFSNVSYSVKWPSVDNARYGHKLAMIYGVGASYNIDDNWAVRASYDRQRFNIQWVYEGLRSAVDLSVAKVGVVYGF